MSAILIIYCLHTEIILQIIYYLFISIFSYTELQVLCIMVRTSYIIHIDAKLIMTSSTTAQDERKNLHDEKKNPLRLHILRRDEH